MIPPLRHDEVAQLLGAYALDAVEADEAAAIEAHLATCPACAAEVAESQHVAALLANRGGDAPAHVWERIAARLETTPTPTEPATARLLQPGSVGPSTRKDEAVDRPRRLHRVRSGAVAAMAAVAVLVIAGLGFQVAHLDHQVGQLQATSHRAAIAQAAQLAAADPLAHRVLLHGTHGSSPALAQIVVLPSGQAFVVDSRLPALRSGRTYQLWAQVGDDLVSVGLLGNHPTDVAFRVSPSARISAFAVTAEQAGGVVRSAHAPVAESPPIAT